MFHIDASTSVIFDVQKFSLHDGPGIRTTIFFKGCPLSCKWCHNPESLRMTSELIYHESLCVGCMACIDACHCNVHAFKNEYGLLKHMLDYKRCKACGNCVKVCCYDALKILGSRYDVKKLADEILEDLTYYKLRTNEEEGGVTFSGGEPMMWAKFIKLLVPNLKGINIAIETSGYAKTEEFMSILPYIDLFLFDYKATDPKRHAELCGTDNALILKNLDAIYNANANIVLRLPLVPGINDDDEHLSGIVNLMKRYPKIDHAEIMPYHDLGVNKAEGLGMHTVLGNLPSATQEQKSQWIKKLKQKGGDKIIISQ